MPHSDIEKIVTNYIGNEKQEMDQFSCLLFLNILTRKLFSTLKKIKSGSDKIKIWCWNFQRIKN